MDFIDKAYTLAYIIIATALIVRLIMVDKEKREATLVMAGLIIFIILFGSGAIICGYFIYIFAFDGSTHGQNMLYLASCGCMVLSGLTVVTIAFLINLD